MVRFSGSDDTQLYASSHGNFADTHCSTLAVASEKLRCSFFPIRLLQDIGLSSNAQNQALDTVKAQLNSAQMQLSAEKETIMAMKVVKAFGL